MRAGLSTATFFGKSLTENSLTLIQDMGVGDVEVFLTTFSEYTRSFAELLNSVKGNLNIHSVHTLTNQFEPQLSNRAERTRTDALNVFRGIADTMKLLGAKNYTFHGTSVIKRNQRVDYPWHGKCVSALCDILGEFGAVLAYENVHWAYYKSPGFLTKLSEFAPKIGATLDIKQAMQADEDYRDFLPEMCGRLRTVHICDYTPDRLCPPGKGNFDFGEMVERLADIGYDGPLMIELYANDYGDFEEVKQSVEYIDEIIYKKL